MRSHTWVGLLVLPLLLAGCAGCVNGPPVTARGIADADASAGARGFALDILVTEGPGGAPIEGAGVVAYYGGVEVGEWSGPRVEVGPDRVLVEPINETGTVESRDVLRMMTGADGTAKARVPGGRIVGVVVAKEGYTEEWIPALAAGETGSSGAITIPLYRDALVVEMDGVWGPGGISSGAVTDSQYAWDPHPVLFGETEEASRGYAARLTDATVTLTWTNGATGAGDLGIGLGPPGDGPAYFSDEGNNVATGVQTETATLDVATLREHAILGASSVQAGAASDTGFVAPFGLPYTMRIEARFDTARAAYASCSVTSSTDDNDGVGASVPGSGVVAALVGLGASAIILSRRSS